MDENEDKFEFDESLIDEVSNSEEFSGEDVSREEVVDAIAAIDALAEVAIEKLGGEDSDINPDELLDKVQELVDSDEDEEEEPEEEESEETSEEEEVEEELPEELENSVVRVMVSEDDSIKVEKTPDEVYDTVIDDVPCTVFDTCDTPDVEVEDEGETDEEDVLVIGNSHSKKFAKGFVKITSCANTKAWNKAYKKVKKMVGSAKLTAAHWAIVSALANSMDKAEKAKKKKVQSALLKLIKNNKNFNAKFTKLIKSDVEPEIAKEGQTEKEVKPEETVKNDSGYKEEGDITKEKSPEEVDSEHKDVEPPTPWDSNEEVVVPTENIINLEVPVKGITQKLILRKVSSSKKYNASTYKVLNSSKIASFVESGKVVKMGNIACCFKKTPSGTFACFARFEKSDDKATKYRPVIKNNRIVIGKEGKSSAAFVIASSIERDRKATKTKIVNSALRNKHLIGSDWKKEIRERNGKEEREVDYKKDPLVKRNHLKAIFKESDWSKLEPGMDESEIKEVLADINPGMFPNVENLRKFLWECAHEGIGDAQKYITIVNKALGMSRRTSVGMRRPVTSRFGRRARIMSMAREDLSPRYDRRASFYGKAQTEDDKLYSYGTLVAEIKDGRPVLYPDWDYSTTTVRHVREWLRQHGFEVGSKADIERMYVTNSRRMGLRSRRDVMSSRRIHRPIVNRRIMSDYDDYEDDVDFGDRSANVTVNPKYDFKRRRTVPARADRIDQIERVKDKVREQVRKVLRQRGLTFVDPEEFEESVDYIMLNVRETADDIGVMGRTSPTVSGATTEWLEDTLENYPETFKPIAASVKEEAKKEEVKEEEPKKEEVAQSKKEECGKEEEKKEETKEEIESKVRKMYEAEERKRLFQNSQTAMNEDKVLIKESVSRNSEALDKLYSAMF